MAENTRKPNRFFKPKEIPWEERPRDWHFYWVVDGKDHQRWNTKVLWAKTLAQAQAASKILKKTHYPPRKIPGRDIKWKAMLEPVQED